MPVRIAVLAATVLLLAQACGGDDSGGGVAATSSSVPTSAPTTTVAAPSTTVAAQQLDVETTPWSLPAPTSRAVVVNDDGTIVVLGGQNAAHASVADVVRIDPATGTATSGGTLDPAVHDAGGVQRGDESIVIAGGAPPARTVVQAVSPGQPTRALGDIPVARTDQVAALVGDTIYVLGGADGSEQMIDGIVSSTDGATWADAGVLVDPVRYPAVATVDGAIYLFGGAREGSPDTTDVQRYDPATKTTQVVAQLPAPLSHASALVLGGQVWIVGGYVDDTPSTQILRFDPTGAVVTAAGSLLAAVTDAGAVATGPATGYLLGGEGPGRSTTAAVVMLSAH